jgi:hypothetical protein
MRVSFSNAVEDTSALFVPDMGAGFCLGPEGNGVSVGEWGEGGTQPPRRQER